MGKMKEVKTFTFCKECKKKVFAYPKRLLTEDDLGAALAHNSEVKMIHSVYNDSDGTSVDHEWSASSQEKDDLRKCLAA
jgi:hypothetical protein